MFTTRSIVRLRARVQMLAAVCAVTFLCGCATLLFKSERESRFINMDSEVLYVSYGEEKRTETLPNGIVCTFDGKVLLQLPDGKRVVLYQTLSSSGMLYASKNKQYEFREKGPYCILTLNGKVFFEGVYCRK